MSRLLSILTSSIIGCVVSCTPLSSLKNFQSSSTKALNRIFEFAVSSLDSIRPARVNIVKVREKDLRKLPSGQEHALAYQYERKLGFWIFNGSTNFQEPALPEIGCEMSIGLLPPRTP